MKDVPTQYSQKQKLSPCEIVAQLAYVVTPSSHKLLVYRIALTDKWYEVVVCMSTYSTVQHPNSGKSDDSHRRVEMSATAKTTTRELIQQLQRVQKQINNLIY